MNEGKGGDLPAPDWEIDWEHQPFVKAQQWCWFESARRGYSAEDLASGRELRIGLLDAEVVSLYSPEYQGRLTALVEHEREQLNLTLEGFWRGDSDPKARRGAMQKLMRRRSKHRVGELSPQDVASFRRNVEGMLRRVVDQDVHGGTERHPGLSWSYTSDMIVDNFAKRLMLFQRLLQHGHGEESGPPARAARRFALIREHAHALLMPFFEYSPGLGMPSDVQQEDERLNASLERCKLGYLPWLARAGADEAEPPARSFIGKAVEEVMDGICSVLINTGTSIEKAWFREFNQHPFKKHDEGRLRAELQVWHDQIEELTAWLGWAPHWMGCNDRLCAWDEECYIPMWPLLRQMSPEKPAYGNRDVDPEEVEYDLWHPRCLKVTEFAAR
ncbi:MAG: hypothetical protein LQ346_006910 [Caloplaca aetnensis]|nr:MAG: hypothetical protein LQ346_006910 [Caloplaca aetnensis]